MAKIPILSVEKIQDIIDGNGGIDWINWLCESHEELRKERDEWKERYRRLAVEKATIRETKDAQPSIRPR